MKNLIFLFCLILASCSVSVPATIPTSTYNTPLGINGLYHGGCDVSLLERLKAWKNPLVRVGISSDYEIDNTFDCLTQYNTNVTITFLVEVIDDYLVSVLANRPESFNVELVNEPDLNNSITKYSWSQFLQRSDKFQSPIHNFYAGGISNPQVKTLDWLSYVPAEMDEALHIYHDVGKSNLGSKGFNSRASENNIIKITSYGHKLHITEFGNPCLDGCDQAALLEATLIDVKYLNDLAPIDAFYYQSVNGPSNTNLDRYALLPLVENTLFISH